MQRLKTTTYTMAVFALITSMTPIPVSSQTKVDVASTLSHDIVKPPVCQFPCSNEFTLPPFARYFSISGPSGTFTTKLTRGAFLLRLEDWREYLEVYRRSIERKQLDAPDWRKANIDYLVEMGKYEQFFESYRNAIRMDRAGGIIYGREDS